MPTSISYTQADGLDRNEPGVAAGLLDLVARSTPAWHKRAACREHPDLTWFPARGDHEAVAAAKAVCSRCPAVVACGSWALAQGSELQGIWAGLSGQERKRKRRPAA